MSFILGSCSTANLSSLQPAADSVTLTVSGFIEADEVAIAAELGGRVIALPIDEGQEVKPGDVLVELDRAVAEAQLRVAQSKRDEAKAALAQLKGGPREADIQQAEAAVAVAEAYRDAAYQSWQDAKMLIANQQALDLQIIQVQSQTAVTYEQLMAAIEAKDAVEIAKDKYDGALEDIQNARSDLGDQLGKRIGGIPIAMLDKKTRDALKARWGEAHFNEVSAKKVGDLSQDDFNAVRDEMVKQVIPSAGYSPIPNQYWQAWVGVNSAGATYDGAVALLAALQAERKLPVQQIAQAHAAEAAYHNAEAAVVRAQAQLADLRAGATPEQIAAAEAQVQVAEAAAVAAQTQLDKLTLLAPVGGVVMEYNIHVGELAAPGAALITLANLDEVSLVVYVPEDKLNFVSVGQTVEVGVDSFPNRVFAGEIVHIASEAEFTPKTVQTREQRTSLVFAVKIRLPNADHALKPGMPADAVMK